MHYGCFLTQISFEAAVVASPSPSFSTEDDFVLAEGEDIADLSE